MTNKGNLSKKEKEIQKDIRELVLARIRAASGDLRVSIGNAAKGYSKKRANRKRRGRQRYRHGNRRHTNGVP